MTQQGDMWVISKNGLFFPHKNTVTNNIRDAQLFLGYDSARTKIFNLKNSFFSDASILKVNAELEIIRDPDLPAPFMTVEMNGKRIDLFTIEQLKEFRLQ